MSNIHLRKKIIDPHCHLWDLKNQLYAWLYQDNSLLGDLSPIRKNYLLADYYQESTLFEVEKIVVVEAASQSHSQQEIAWLTKIADKRLAGIVAGIDLSSPQAERLLANYSKVAKIKGVRQLLNWHRDHRYRSCQHNHYLSDSTWLNHYAKLKLYNLSFDMQVNPQQLVMVYQLAKRFPDINIILNHTAMPIEDELAAWRKNCQLLANCPNVFIKISGFAMLDHDYSQQSIEDKVLYIIDVFGCHRCSFASNFPIDKLYRDFDSLWQQYVAIVADFSHHEKNNLFYQNATTIYNI